MLLPKITHYLEEKKRTEKKAVLMLKQVGVSIRTLAASRTKEQELSLLLMVNLVSSEETTERGKTPLRNAVLQLQ